MKILVVDDHPLFLSGIRQVLEHSNGSTADIFEASSVAAALSLIEAHPDLDWILLDLQLPGADGFALLGELAQRRTSIPVVIVSSDTEPATVDRALRAGASGYLSKSAPSSEIVEALHTLEHTGRYVARSLRGALDAYRSGAIARTGLAVELTRRQHQILGHIAQGLGNREIAQRLSLAESTVKGHIATLFSIFDAGNRTECVHEARRMRLLD